MRAAAAGGAASVRAALRGNARRYGMVIALAAIVVLFQVLTGGLLLRPANVSNLVLQNSYVLILAVGMMLVIITGHIDLSVGSVVAFTGAVSAIMLAEWGLPLLIVLPLSLLVGGLIGAWQGFWVAYVGLPAFIVTLAGMLVFRGLTLLVLGGESVGDLPPEARRLATGFVPGFEAGGVDIVPLALGAAVAALVVIGLRTSRSRALRHGIRVVPAPAALAVQALAVAAVLALCTAFALHSGVPWVGALLLVLIAGYALFMAATVPGRRVYATGGNPKAAELSGVRTKRTVFWVFVNMGALSALAGLVFTARLNLAAPGAGTMFELDAIAAAFIGGASASGGVGTVVGAVVGALVMGVLNNGMSIIGLGVDWQQAIKGLVLLVAVAFDVLGKKGTLASGLQGLRGLLGGRSGASPGADGPGGAGGGSPLHGAAQGEPAAQETGDGGVQQHHRQGVQH
ncbi:multiple monosaccharide ABC transporter permease [Nocardiopsis chromatogenes]|uniref:multiple monosaccharide ABC transporter permease n=1 Tax=Nocardiopsis chromatogenes TaxID=280239 RepID=UPI00037C2AEB|nr:multiple monosaccharide ABC transporter permease [Nocardiopsis chromatogenes]